MKVFHQGYNACHKSLILFNKNHNTRHEKPHYELLIVVIHETLKTLLTAVVALS